MRTIDPLLVQPAINELVSDVDAAEWLAKPGNIALIVNDGDIGLMERSFQGNDKVYSCHCIFQSRGKEALVSAKKLIDEIFDPCYNVHVLTTLTPDHRRDVKLLARRAGFKSQGIEELHGKLYELFIITKAQHDQHS